jgi:hypothetical protein
MRMHSVMQCVRNAHMQGTRVTAIGAQFGTFPAPHLSGTEVAAYIAQPQAVGPGRVLYPVVGKTSLSARAGAEASVVTISVVSASAALIVAGSYVQVRSVPLISRVYV